MSEKQRRYDSTVARIAGNIVTGLISGGVDPRGKDHGAPSGELAIEWAWYAVKIARAIVAEVERTEPASQLAAAAIAREA